MSTASPTAQPAQPRPDLSAVALPKNARGLAIGETGSGKSTLCEQLISRWRREMPAPRVLILDSKPRFRAEWHLNGVSARHLYRQWGHGEVVPGSVLLPLQNPGAELRQAWRLGYTVAIAQVDRVRGLEDAPALLAATAEFFRASQRKYQQLCYFDEGADFFGSAAAFGRGNPVVQVARSGREVGCAMLLSTQRPRHIPTAVITETSQLYCFSLSFERDWKHLQEMGLPAEARPPQEPHEFLFYSKLTRSGGYYRLDLRERK